MAGIESKDPVIIHLMYIREKVDKLAEEDNKQWEEIGLVRKEVNAVDKRVSRQAGANGVLAVIAGAVTSALVQMGLRK